MKTLSLFAIGALSLLPLGSQALPLNDDFAVELELTLASDYRCLLYTSPSPRDS